MDTQEEWDKNVMEGESIARSPLMAVLYMVMQSHYLARETNTQEDEKSLKREGKPRGHKIGMYNAQALV